MKKKHILIVDEGASFGGSLIVASHMMEWLPSDKFHVSLICEVDPRYLKKYSDSQKIHVLHRPINYVDRQKFVDRIDATRGIRTKIVKRIAVLLFSMWVYYRNADFRKNLREHIKRLRIDVVHTNNTREVIRVALDLDVPVVWHLHGLLPDKPTFRDRADFRRVTRFIAISDAVLRSAVVAGVPNQKIIKISNPCVISAKGDLDLRRELRNKYKIAESARVFAIVGRIIEWKGQAQFLEAANIVLEQASDAVAVVVGDSSEFDSQYEESVKELAASFGHEGRIIFTGYVDNMSEIYNMIDLLVHASIEPEPFGLVITEAMAKSVPVIAANLGAPREIIQDRINGFLVNPMDKHELSNAIINVLSNPKLGDSVSREAMAMVRKRYSPESFADQLEMLYDSLSKSKR